MGLKPKLRHCGHDRLDVRTARATRSGIGRRMGTAAGMFLRPRRQGPPNAALAHASIGGLQPAAGSGAREVRPVTSRFEGPRRVLPQQNRTADARRCSLENRGPQGAEQTQAEGFAIGCDYLNGPPGAGVTLIDRILTSQKETCQPAGWPGAVTAYFMPCSLPSACSTSPDVRSTMPIAPRSVRLRVCRQRSYERWVDITTRLGVRAHLFSRQEVERRDCQTSWWPQMLVSWIR